MNNNRPINELTPKGLVLNFILLPSSDKEKYRAIKEAEFNMLNGRNNDVDISQELRTIILKSK